MSGSQGQGRGDEVRVKRVRVRADTGRHRGGRVPASGRVADHASWRGRHQGQVRDGTRERLAGTDHARPKSTPEPLKTLGSGWYDTICILKRSPGYIAEGSSESVQKQQGCW